MSSTYLPPALRTKAPLKNAPLKNAPPKNAPLTADAFPVWESKKKDSPSDASIPATPATPAKKSFSDLARVWGTQQKEDDEKSKTLAKDKALREQLEREEKEKELRFFRIHSKTTSLLQNRTEDTDYNLGGAEEDSLSSEEAYEEYVEEEDTSVSEEDLDAEWHRRRHKNDL